MSRYTRTVLTIIAICLVYLCLRDLPLWPRSEAAAPSRDGHFRRLTAESFAVTDKSGIPRMVATCEERGVVLALADSNNNPCIMMAVTSRGDPNMALAKQGRTKLWQMPPPQGK
ncbi:hypothetical protein ACFL09_06120 [Planctomycetota bacterium]